MSRIKIEKFEYEDGTSEYKILVNVNYVKCAFCDKLYGYTVIDDEWYPVFTKNYDVFNVHPDGRRIYNTFEDALADISIIKERILVKDEVKIKNRTVWYEVQYLKRIQ